jgi:putative alpha-1,2-mannosidase
MRSFLFLFLFFSSGQLFGQQPADLANPLVATVKPRYDYFAAATLPYGLVSLSPDTHHGNLWDAGYRYKDASILFAHIHNAQTAGIPDMPVVGVCKALKGLNPSNTFCSRSWKTWRSMG